MTTGIMAHLKNFLTGGGNELQAGNGIVQQRQSDASRFPQQGGISNGWRARLQVSEMRKIGIKQLFPSEVDGFVQQEDMGGK